MDNKSYALGLGIAQNLMGMGIKKGDLNVEDFAKAMSDAFANKPEMDYRQAQIIASQYIDELDKKMTDARIKANEEYLENNKQIDGVVTTESGLQYKIINPGDPEAKHAGPTDTVSCHYEGWLLDGTLFDSSLQRGMPAEFGVNQVIPGWTEALQLMNPGAKWHLVIPSDLAYGAQGAGGVIPPHSALIFDVELLKVL
ncbi:MAG: FKBP-type peptidyl-prolyl cis-trans isomerase [Bacteroidales bacterium]|jgi:FKBP-type peptidyl-prolyl cis-trans isomerase FklB|nr:FKBP-type peptidyl-prolyl cis-trans isomerase [Bacteroidaceae bacterium]MDO4187213.1 FKBP-type peptidyl-prolyl cis-trans isomerase [Bacteroidales bacterium]MBR1940373.1 FKBP-type peptidyl-prolyl cis-trans isomerase [Bacteroidaceae bacterium]MBR3014532.1 FKBP-type peptidyl-prolyl cis-trans isomerase [Bacteroidaceae bacterium]MBR3625492.1 FKBP-type peptidyl-prolyl cis-trans isomerase [Bacteroidaceae bacterium]